jgi:hypothetical protein
MKKQLSKNLSAFIIIMMFSISFVNAQCKTGEVLMYLGGFKGGCSQRCVKLNQVDHYIKKGWSIMPCSGTGPYSSPNITQSNNKISKRRLPKIPVDNAIASNKILRR